MKIHILNFINKRKKEEFINHSIRIEHLLGMERAEVEAKAAILVMTGKEPSEYEIDEHLDNIYSFDKSDNLFRAQMLVSICGYFEYSIKKMAAAASCKNINNDLGLKELIDSLSRRGIGVIDASTRNTLHEYRHIRNACTHHNLSSDHENINLANAEKYLTGIDIVHWSGSNKGKGKIELRPEFLGKAINVHFDVLKKTHDSYTKAAGKR